MRRLINLLAVVSLLLCVAMAALWVRSLWRVDQVEYVPAPSRSAGPAEEGAMAKVKEQTFLIQSNAGGLMGAWYLTSRSTDLRGLRESDLGLKYHSDEWVRYPVRPANHPLIESRIGLLGFEYALSVQDVKRIGLLQRHYTLVIPMWAVCLVLALPPVIVFRRRWREWRRREGNLCLQCGYDLRATTGRCPECGAEAAVPTPD